jgi:phosphate/sulfate permease
VSKWIAGCAVVVAAAGSVLAFVVLDPILAAFIAILLVTGSVVAVLARDWDRHPTFEDREAARARKRAAKWVRGQDARAKDRAKWEAHQARQAKKGAASPESPDR